MKSNKKSATKAANVSVTIAVDDAGLKVFDKTIATLKKSGLTVVWKDKDAGNMYGTCSPEKIPSLRSVKGVAAVEAERTIEMPLPEAEIQ